MSKKKHNRRGETLQIRTVVLYMFDGTACVCAVDCVSDIIQQRRFVNVQRNAFCCALVTVCLHITPPFPPTPRLATPPTMEQNRTAAAPKPQALAAMFSKVVKAQAAPAAKKVSSAAKVAPRKPLAAPKV